MYIYVLYKAVFSPWSFTGFLPWPFKRTWEALNNLLTKKILHCWHNIYPGGFLYFFMVNPRWWKAHMVLKEDFANRDSGFSEEESEDVSEYNGNSSGSTKDDESGKDVQGFKEHDSPSASEDSESEEEDAAPNRSEG